MENSLTYVGSLINLDSRPLLLQSPDFPSLHNLCLPGGCGIPVQFNVPADLKLKEDRWVDKTGRRIMMICLVDKDY